MKFFTPSTLLALAVSNVYAASQWGFIDATVSVSAKGAGVGSGSKDKLSMNKPLSKVIDLGLEDTLKVILTTQEGKAAKRPHQAFLQLKDGNGLETSFPLSVKETGKAKVDLSPKDFPPQLLRSNTSLSASLIIASFGSSSPYSSPAFTLNLKQGDAPSATPASQPSRYSALPEIHHIFRADPKSPPRIISLFFMVIVLSALPLLLGAWLVLGANVNHLSKALGASPVGHALYLGGIVAMQGVFFLYYTSWNLFKTLPAALVLSAVILISGSRALTEVQQRRLGAQR